MTTKPLKIISGGQTGVDRAGLDAALALHFPCGGWCPQGHVDEDGIIPGHYPLTELKKGGYLRRTIQNLMDADGTLIFYFTDLKGGTAETAYRCIKHHKPFKLIDGDEISISRAIELSAAFISAHGIYSLNIAGPRASRAPHGYQYAYDVTAGLLGRLGQGTGA